MTNEEKKKFYEECMNCRIGFNCEIENDCIDEFYRLIDEYAEKKMAHMKCCANCKHSGYNDANGCENCRFCHIDKAYCIIDKNNHDWTSKCDKWELDENLKDK